MWGRIGQTIPNVQDINLNKLETFFCIYITDFVNLLAPYYEGSSWTMPLHKEKPFLELSIYWYN